MKIKTSVDIPAEIVRGCVVHGRGPHYSLEVGHQCLARQLLFEALAKMVPLVLQSTDVYSFITLNKEKNPSANCLFDGIQLELRTEPKSRPEFGFCFARSAFVAERDRFTSLETQVNLWEGWAHREPTDSDRLRINKRGCEILYFVRPPFNQPKVTISNLRSELASSLGIVSLNRLVLTAGPFVWDDQFEEDERNAHDTYFRRDLVTDSRHMKTMDGSALIYVHEK
jgi:hypothetical protein